MSNKMKKIIGLLGDTMGDQSKPWYKLFFWAHDRFRVNPIDSSLVAATVLAAFLICGFDGMVVSNLIGFWYPFHVTVALMAVPWPAAGTYMVKIRKADMVEQLSYWLIFAGVLSVECLVGSLLRLIPLYLLVKTGFLVWCFSWNGSAVVCAYITERLRDVAGLKARLPNGYPLKVIDTIGGLVSDRSKPWYQLYFWAHKRYEVNPIDSLTVAALVWAALLSCGFDLIRLGSLIGFSYPCHVTVAMLAVPWPADGSDMAKIRRADTVELVSYWLIFDGILFVENVVGFLLRPIPLYSLIKTGFIVWCLSWKGSAVIRAHVLERFNNVIHTNVDAHSEPRPQLTQRAPVEKSQGGLPSALAANR